MFGFFCFLFLFFFCIQGENDGVNIIRGVNY